VRSKQEALRNQQEVAHTEQIATLKHEHETSLAGNFTALMKRPILCILSFNALYFEFDVIYSVKTRSIRCLCFFSRAQEDA